MPPNSSLFVFDHWEMKVIVRNTLTVRESNISRRCCVVCRRDAVSRDWFERDVKYVKYVKYICVEQWRRVLQIFPRVNSTNFEISSSPNCSELFSRVEIKEKRIIRWKSFFPRTSRAWEIIERVGHRSSWRKRNWTVKILHESGSGFVYRRENEFLNSYRRFCHRCTDDTASTC